MTMKVFQLVDRFTAPNTKTYKVKCEGVVTAFTLLNDLGLPLIGDPYSRDKPELVCTDVHSIPHLELPIGLVDRLMYFVLGKSKSLGRFWIVTCNYREKQNA